VGRVVFGIRADELLGSFDLHGRQSLQELTKVLGLGQRQEIKIQSVSTRIDRQDVLSNVLVFAQGHFQGG